AVKWACSVLKDPAELLSGGTALPLSAFDDKSPEGKRLLASAQQLLVYLGKKDAKAIAVDDVADTAKIFAQTKFNGDGVIPADASDDAAVNAVVADIISCVGSLPDRSGKPGVDESLVTRFFAEAEAFSGWHAKAEADAANVFPLGDATVGAFAAVEGVKAKIDDFFARCRLAAFDARALTALNREEKEYFALAAKDLTITLDELSGFPLAMIAPEKSLSFADALNPAWAGRIAKFASDVVKPLLGERTELSPVEWDAIKAKFGPHACWLAGKAGAAAEKLGLPRVREILGGGSKGAILALIAQDKALEDKAGAIDAVDRLLRYHRSLAKLLVNFVNFQDFYTRADRSVFQAGTLFLDQRSCELCLRVDDAGRHASLAGLAKTYLAYCDLTRPASGEKMTIAAAFTAGDSDNLMVGRNGIFYDPKGRDWDATITKVIENPISVRQAFWSPYKRFIRMIEEQVAKRAAAAEAASTSKLETAAASVATADQPAKKPAEPKKLDVGVVAALGVAVGAIGAAISALVTGLLQLQTWQIPLVFVGIMLAISAPSVVIAWIKLRQRNLGPILDANGWAVNTKARINIRFGASLTRVAKLPKGSARDLRDPYAPSRVPLLVGLAIVLWAFYKVESLAAMMWEGKKTLAQQFDSSLSYLVPVLFLAAVFFLWKIGKAYRLPKFLTGFFVFLLLALSLWNFGAIERFFPGKIPQTPWVKHRVEAGTAPPAPAPVEPAK
ncbi:MAG: hypothetical protein MUE73_17640, partial [Planctomycetes bacterium]|nr:hypothetical protein [Planctomycetota bacterium]